LAEKFELLGLFGVDFILDGDNVWTLEVNPRYTASVEIVERFNGTSAIAAHAAACRGDGCLGSSASETPVASHSGSSPLARPQPPSRSHGKAILFAKRDVVISDQFAEATLSEALRTPWPSLADVSITGTPIAAGRPVLTIFAEAGTVDEVEQHLRTRALKLEQSLYLNG
jgi:predicted ATP-grasp superfamily ATP-dependent carboligase